MSQLEQRTVTVIYYLEGSLELLHESGTFDVHTNGRVIIPDGFKKNKSIVAVCDGEIKLLNKLGERILSVGYVV